MVRYVEGRCRKCDATIKLYLGEMDAHEAQARLRDMSPFECPGGHVELSNPLNYWDIDWSKVVDEGDGPPTDDEWLAGMRDRYRTVVDTEGLREAVEKVEGFAAGMCVVRRNGKREYVDFAMSPSGRRYYLLDPVTDHAHQLQDDQQGGV